VTAATSLTAVPAPDRLHVGFLVPRYGVEIIGGAEFGARMLAEHLVDLGCAVEVFTTCARDARTWADSYPAGTTVVNGVTVHRFASGWRHPDFDALSGPVLAHPEHVDTAAADRWIDLQGPRCPEALDAAEASAADVVVLYPYLYWPTVHGVRRLGRRAVLQPAAHDEAPIRLPLFTEVFTGPGGVVFHTDSERRLVQDLFPGTEALPQAVVGLGVEVGVGDERAARDALGLGDRPYLVCVGRLDEQKGTSLLARWFAAYKQRHPGPLALALIGPVSDAPGPHPDIVVTGIVDDEVKWGALRGARVLVSPSPYESFSVVLIEGWLAGLPALVNGACHPTTEHCWRSGGGIPFGGYAEFEVALDRIERDPQLAAALGRAGRDYAEAHYAWPRLIRRYHDFLQLVAARRDRPHAEVPA
jgi:glycosyltransferase involved in cell wall biosynthesis